MSLLQSRISWPLVGVLAAAVILLLALFLLGKVPLSYNLRNLTVRWKTTVMTALAFTLVVSLLTVMLAFVNGMYRLTATSGQPGNVILLAEGSTDESFSSLAVKDVGDIALQSGIVSEGDKRLCSPETYFSINQPYRVTSAPPPASGLSRMLAGILRLGQSPKPKGRFVQLRGVEDPVIAGRVHGLSLEAGEWFSSSGVRESGKDGLPLIEAVVGGGLARELGRDRPAEELAAAKNKLRIDVGDTFPLRGRQWIVTGVMESSGSTFDSEIWAKRSVIGPAFGKDTYTSFVVRAEDAAAAVTLRDFFNNDFKAAALLAQVETDYFAGLSQTSKQFLYAVIGVALVMAAGGIFGVTNTMFAAIAQRTKDIGVLRLIGYSRWQVLVSFLLESLIIALAGGLLGCAIGLLFDGLSVSSVVGGGQGASKFVVLKMAVDANVLSAGILLTLVMGFIGGFIPAVSAVLLKPLEALR